MEFLFLAEVNYLIICLSGTVVKAFAVSEAIEHEREPNYDLFTPKILPVGYGGSY